MTDRPTDDPGWNPRPANEHPFGKGGVWMEGIGADTIAKRNGMPAGFAQLMANIAWAIKKAEAAANNQRGGPDPLTPDHTSN